MTWGIYYERKEEAPFSLADGETLDLDIFVDKLIVEVYANERQAIVRARLPVKAGNGSEGVRGL